MKPVKERFCIAFAIFLVACTGVVDSGCCCPTYWTAFREHCYRFFSINIGWQNAEMFCQNFSVPSKGYGDTTLTSLAHLASIHSAEEQNFVFSFFQSSMKKGETAFLWIGLHDTSTEETFEWTDGTGVDFTFWGEGQPDDWSSNEDCAHMRTGGRWNDLPCSHSNVNYFICKLPLW